MSLNKDLNESRKQVQREVNFGTKEEVFSSGAEGKTKRHDLGYRKVFVFFKSKEDMSSSASQPLMCI